MVHIHLHAGDIFLREGHTGIIVSVSGNSFTTVEGNTGGTSNCRNCGEVIHGALQAVIMIMCLIRNTPISQTEHHLPEVWKAICIRKNSYGGEKRTYSCME